MLHPLDGAHARIDRADKHLRELHLLLDLFRDRSEREFFAEYETQARHMVAGESQDSRRTNYQPPIVDPDIPIVLSDVVHNLRAALDYLVFELAREDSGVEQKRTQFPIEDCESQFDGNAHRLLAGVDARHVGMIKDLQPCKGVQWTALLRDISNQDKHRKLTVALSYTRSDVRIEADRPGSFDDRPTGHLFAGVGTDGSDVHVESEYAIDVTLDDGSLLRETLEDLKREVATTINRFKPEFKI